MLDSGGIGAESAPAGASAAAGIVNDGGGSRRWCRERFDGFARGDGGGLGRRRWRRLRLMKGKVAFRALVIAGEDGGGGD